MPDPRGGDEVLSAHMEATKAVLLVLVRCLEENGALEPSQFSEALLGYTEMAQEVADPMQIALLHDIRQAFLN